MSRPETEAIIVKNLILLIVSVLTLAGGALWWFWPFGENGAMRLSGVVEIQEVRLGSKVGGRVYEILTHEGDEIYPGRRLAVLEVPEWLAQRDQWKARVDAAQAELEKALNGFRVEEKKAAQSAADAAKARLDRLLAGWRPEEIRQVESEYHSTLAEKRQAEEEFIRINELHRTRSAAKSDYDLALSIRDRARGRADAAKAKHDLYVAGARAEDIAEARAEYTKAQAKVEEMYNGTRPEDVKLAQAKFAEAKAKLTEAEVFVEEAVLKAPEKLGKARVEVISVRPGDIVSANQPIIRVLRTEDWWVKIFVPETKMGHVKDGMKVRVFVDTFPGKAFHGVIEQISNISEFTPRNVQSLDERRHQVFAVKVRVLDAEEHFHAGMAAEVVIEPRE